MDYFNSTDFVASISMVNNAEPYPLTSLLNSTTSSAQFSIFLSVSFIVGIHSCIGLVPNFAVLCLLVQQKRTRSLHYLNAHLAVVSILILCQGIMYLSDDKRHSESSGCSLIVYLRNCLINLLALTVLSISHERVRSLEVQRHLRNDVNVLRVTVGIWGCSLIAAIPAFFSAHFVQHVHPDGVLHAACVKGPLLGNFVLGLVYESLRCLVFHILLSCYLMFELYKIRSKLKYFYFRQPVPSRRLKKVRRVRFIFINSITFTLIWFPFGLFHSIYTPFRDLDKIQHFEIDYSNLDEAGLLFTEIQEGIKDPTKKPFNRHPVLYYVGICAIYMYIILLPVIIYCTHNNALKHFRRLGRRLTFWKREANSVVDGIEKSKRNTSSNEISKCVGGTTVARSYYSPEGEDECPCELMMQETHGNVSLKQTIVTINIELVDDEVIDEV
ncbi:uncharacterized protein LOC118434394 isoform X2 [Folsomia candida]|uniref:uncharacterized protein LOC118434394 isoform X2 n=1 Tax=Folsomia candida TaxID=158441 RepID=UPI001604E4F6|nr:uncharacterized protein LOC118434394 isoform X2 [Folsomia candida]